MSKLIDRVIVEIQRDFAMGDLTALDELLSFIPRENLIGFLPEEEWEEYENVITEETDIVYSSDEQLSYEFCGDDSIELYVDNTYLGLCKVWLDSEMENREYITLNYTIVYLDTITLK